MKYLLLCLLLSVSLSLPAQTFFNSGFEDWTAFPGYFDPTGYETWNWTSTDTIFDMPLLTKRSTPHSGNYSIECLVDTNIACSTCSPDTISGFAVAFNAFPFSNRPANLFGYFQLISGSGLEHKGNIMITLSRWNSALMERESVAATGFLSTSPTGASWQNFSVPLFYFTSWGPDTISVEIYVNGDPGTRFLVDDLMFTGSVGLDGSVQQDAFQIYPNPVSDEFRILTPTLTSQQVRIIDALGQVKWQGQIQGDTPVFVNELPSGLYLVECTDLSSMSTSCRRMEVIH